MGCANILKAVIGPLIPELGQRLAQNSDARKPFIFLEALRPHLRSQQARVARLTSSHHFNNSEISWERRWSRMEQAPRV